jgi:hypothetical protein
MRISQLNVPSLRSNFEIINHYLKIYIFLKLISYFIKTAERILIFKISLEKNSPEKLKLSLELPSLRKKKKKIKSFYKDVILKTSLRLVIIKYTKLLNFQIIYFLIINSLSLSYKFIF